MRKNFFLWLELRIYSQGVQFFDKSGNTIHELGLCDKPSLTLKISVTSFEDFDIKFFCRPK